MDAKLQLSLENNRENLLGRNSNVTSGMSSDSEEFIEKAKADLAKASNGGSRNYDNMFEF